MDIRLSKVKVGIPKSERVLFRIAAHAFPFGSKVLIQGMSGKGKTTFLHLLAGLFLPDEGCVHIGDYPLHTLPDESRARIRRRHIGMIFQKLNLIDYLTAEENVLLAIGEGRDSSSRARQSLDAVNLRGRYRERSANLSLGEQQRVAVARILAVQPDLVLADEPTSSLDTANGELIIDALLRATVGKTLIVVSHDERLRSRFNTVIQFQDLIDE